MVEPDTSGPHFPQRALIASIGVPASSMQLLQKHLTRFNISADTQALKTIDEVDAATQRWDAVAIQVNAKSVEWMKAIRQSSRNRHALIYAFGDEKSVAALVHMGINSLIEEPTDAILSREVESTHLLLLRQLRRFVRIPLVTVVTVFVNSDTYIAVSRNLSAGGMNLSFPHEIHANSKIRLSFSLPSSPIFTVQAAVCRLSHGSLGLEFLNPADYHKIRNWIENYLEVSQ